MHVKLLPDPSMLKAYQEHNFNLEGDIGLDLIIPEDIKIYYNTTTRIDLKVKAAGYGWVIKGVNEPSQQPIVKYEEVGYFLLPRSSITKYPFRLANSVGVIDLYRGNLEVRIDNNVDMYHSYSGFNAEQLEIQFEPETGRTYTIITAGTRLFQIVDPKGEGITWEIVTELPPTVRGSAGLGSTGR